MATNPIPTSTYINTPTLVSFAADLPGLKQAAWESRYHWLCRRKFIEDHRNMYTPERVICLSMVWSNINFMGCKYSDKLEDRVSYYPVPDQSELDRWLDVHKDIREEEKEEVKITMKRTLGSSDTIEIPAKIQKIEKSITDASRSHDQGSSDTSQESCDSIPFEDLTHHLDALISTIRKKQDQDSVPNQPGSSPSSQLHSQTNTNNSNVHDFIQNPRRIRIIQQLGGLCMCEKCYGGNSNPLCSLDVLCSRIAHTIVYDFDSESTPNQFVCKVFIDGTLTSRGNGSQKKEAKRDAAHSIIQEVNEYQQNHPIPCPSLGRKVVELKELSESMQKVPKISEDNKGHQMLRKMGWSSKEGLGVGGQGRKEPVVAYVNEEGTRGGFGSKGHSGIFSQNIRTKLQEFLMSDDTQLEFSSDLSSEDRKLIHLLSEQYHLQHKSHGTGKNRSLIIQKKVGRNYDDAVLGTGVGPGRYRNQSHREAQIVHYYKPY